MENAQRNSANGTASGNSSAVRSSTEARILRLSDEQLVDEFARLLQQNEAITEALVYYFTLNRNHFR